ncbi:MAG TPA: FGGY-family carbohydrate kinase [Chloroflexota bacterium]
MPEAVLGIDVGTGSLKAGLFTLDGALLDMRQAKYALRSPADDAQEQDPLDWWAALSTTCREIMHASDAHVLALAVAGQAPTLVPVDADLKPTHPAISWLDPRPSAEAQQLYARLGQTVPVWGSWPAQAAWFTHNRPEALRRTRWLLGCPDFLTSRLVCAPTALLSITEAELTAGGLDRRYFPEAWTPGRVIGRVSPAASEETGLPVGTPVVGGHVDGLLGVLGSGVKQPGEACANCGTSATFTVVSEPPLGYPMFDLHVAGTAANAGAALNWFIDNLADPGCSYADLFDSAAGIAPGADGLVFLPTLAGDRGATNDAYARGAWVGLTLVHTRAHLFRALLEGVAFSFRSMQDWLESSGAPVRDVRCVGGQARSHIWNQIKADILDRVVLLPRVVEAVAVGAAILAALGIGAYSDLASAVAAMVRIERRFEPDPDRVAHYARVFETYRSLHPTLRETNWRLHELARRS